MPICEALGVYQILTCAGQVFGEIVNFSICLQDTQYFRCIAISYGNIFLRIFAILVVAGEQAENISVTML